MVLGEPETLPAATMVVILSDDTSADELRELTCTTAAEAAQIAAGEGSATLSDVWARGTSAEGSLGEAAWSAP